MGDLFESLCRSCFCDIALCREVPPAHESGAAAAVVRRGDGPRGGGVEGEPGGGLRLLCRWVAAAHAVEIDCRRKGGIAEREALQGIPTPSLSSELLLLLLLDSSFEEDEDRRFHRDVFVRGVAIDLIVVARILVFFFGCFYNGGHPCFVARCF